MSCLAGLATACGSICGKGTPEPERSVPPRPDAPPTSSHSVSLGVCHIGSIPNAKAASSTAANQASEAICDEYEVSWSAPPPPSGGVDIGSFMNTRTESLRTIDKEYDMSWTSAATASADTVLRVEVLEASDLARPEYRVGDVAKRLLRSRASGFRHVYVEVSFGERTFRTAEIAAGESRVVTFDGSKNAVALFALPPTPPREIAAAAPAATAPGLAAPLDGSHQLRVVVRDRRPLQGAIRGDPLIGEAVLPLSWERNSCEMKVPIARDGRPAGVVSLSLRTETVNR